MTVTRPTCLGLRIDVDTSWGARWCLPRLLDVMAEHHAAATVFVPAGPDQSWQACFRMLTQPGYLAKLVRSNALLETGLPSALSAVLLRRTPLEAIEPKTMQMIRSLGCELGAHGHSHTGWHNNYQHWDSVETQKQVSNAIETFRTNGLEPTAWASPGWQFDFKAMLALENRGFTWCSDTRGHRPFLPLSSGVSTAVVQIPVTLPSLDEFQRGLPPEEPEVEDFLRLLENQTFPVYAAHTELDGWRYLPFFQQLLSWCRTRSIPVVPLGSVLKMALKTGNPLPTNSVTWAQVPGRPGAVAAQDSCNNPGN